MTLKEKEIIRNFVFKFTKEFQKLQDCGTYEEVIELLEKTDRKVEKKLWFIQFSELIKKMQNEVRDKDNL